MTAHEAELTKLHAGMGGEAESLRAGIVKKQRRRAVKAMSKAQSMAVHAMTGLPPKDKKEDSDGSNSSDDEQTRLDPYCIFDRYFRERDGKGDVKGKGKANDV